MVNIIKETFNVTFDKPFSTCESSLYGNKGSVTTSVWTKTMRDIFKMSLIDSFQNHLHYLLHQLVIERRDTKRTELAVLLWYVYPSCRHWRIAFIS